MKASLFSAILFPTAHSFVVTPSLSDKPHCPKALLKAVDYDGLMDMDIVLFSPNGSEEIQIGAVQEDGRLAPLSAWSDEPAFGDAIELVVDEEDRPGFKADQIVVHSVIPENSLSYGSRQVGGGKGTFSKLKRCVE